jgi:hypothetical protein
MADEKRKDPSRGEDGSIDRPRLTPQGRANAEKAGEDQTDPTVQAKQGQSDKPEG